jgi:hypothetical protein
MYVHNIETIAVTPRVECNGWGDPDIVLPGVTERVLVGQQGRTIEIHISLVNLFNPPCRAAEGVPATDGDTPTSYWALFCQPIMAEVPEPRFTEDPLRYHKGPVPSPP